MRKDSQYYKKCAKEISNSMRGISMVILLLTIVAVVYFDTMSIWKDLWFIIVFGCGGVCVIKPKDDEEKGKKF